MLCKVLYYDYGFNAVFYCGRSEALAKVSEWIVSMAISFTRLINLLDLSHVIFLCFPLCSTCARCHFQTDFFVCVKDAQHEGQPSKCINGCNFIDEQQRLVFNGIRLHSPWIITGNATPAPSVNIKEVLQKQGSHVSALVYDAHLYHFICNVLLYIQHIQCLTFFIHTHCTCLCSFLHFTYVDAHTCIEGVKYTCLHTTLKRKYNILLHTLK